MNQSQNSFSGCRKVTSDTEAGARQELTYKSLGAAGWEEHVSSIARALDPMSSTTNKENCWHGAWGSMPIELHMGKQMAVTHWACDGTIRTFKHQTLGALI